MGILNSNESLFIVSFELDYDLTSSKADFLKVPGLTIYSIDPVTKAVKSFQGGRTLNSLEAIRQYRGYQVQNKSTSNIEFNNRYGGFGVKPSIEELSVSEILTNKLPNLPTSKRNNIILAIQEGAKIVGTENDLAESLDFLRNWYYFQSSSDEISYTKPFKVESWGSSLDPIEQTSITFQPLLTSEGLQFSLNPPTYVNLNTNFITNTFTVFLAIRREALNSGYLIANSHMVIGYNNSTTFRFNNLNYTIEDSLGNSFELYACQYDGTLLKLFLEGDKVAEVNATPLDLSTITSQLGGVDNTASFIGTLKILALTPAVLSEQRVKYISTIFREQIKQQPTTLPEIAEGTITVTSPIANSVIAVNNQGIGVLHIEGSFTLDEDSAPVNGIEISFANGLYETIITNPQTSSFTALIPKPASIGDLIVRFKNNPSISVTITNIALAQLEVTNLQASVSGKTINLNWNPPSGVIIVSYTIGISEDNGSTWVDTPNISNALTSYSYADRIGGTYRVRIQAILDTSVSSFVVSDSLIVQPTDPAILDQQIFNKALSLWRFDDTTWSDVKNYSTFIVTGTPALGSPLVANSVGSLSLDGATTRLNVTDTLRYRLNANHTIIGAVRAKSVSTGMMILTKSNNTPGGRAWVIQIANTSGASGGDRVSIRYSLDGNSYGGTLSTPYHTTGSLIYFIIQYSAGNFLRIRSQLSTDWSQVTGVTLRVFNRQLCIGATELNGVYSSFGNIDLDFLYWADDLLNREEYERVIKANPLVQL